MKNKIKIKFKDLEVGEEFKYITNSGDDYRKSSIYERFNKVTKKYWNTDANADVWVDKQVEDSRSLLKDEINSIIDKQINYVVFLLDDIGYFKAEKIINAVKLIKNKINEEVFDEVVVE